jgi:hypothetical protein
MALHRSSGLVLLVCTAAAAAVAGAAPAESGDLVRILIGQAAFGERHWERLEGGGAVAALSTSADPAQVSLVGAVRVDVPPDTFVERFRQIERIERGKTVRQIGRFSQEPCVDDLAALAVDPRDVDSLRKCRPGDCGLQLPTEAIERLRAVSEAPGNGDAPGRLVDEYRRFLIELISDYRRQGLAALDGYHDKDEPLSVGDAFNRLLARPGGPMQHLPELSRNLRAYPRPNAAGADEFFYWSTLDFGLKPTLRINHVVIHPVHNRGDGLRYAIASRQIYASHYFDAALELRMVVADPARAGHTILVYSSEARSRSLTGVIGGFLRGQVKSRARAALEHYLHTTKAAVEGRRGN